MDGPNNQTLPHLQVPVGCKQPWAQRVEPVRQADGDGREPPVKVRYRSKLANTGAWSLGFSQPRASRRTRLEFPADEISDVAQT